MSAEDSITQFVERLREGDDHAAAQLWERFFDRLSSAARRRMRSIKTGVNDEEDIVASAFKSFCVGLRAGRFDQLQGRDSLWRLLMVITARKVADKHAFDHRQKRSVDRVASIDDDNALIHDLVCRDPSPAIAAEMSEQLEARLELLKQHDLQQVALFRMEGYTNEDIATMLNRSLSTIERKLRTIRAIWSQIE